jgi:hypothetical protein
MTTRLLPEAEATPDALLHRGWAVTIKGVGYAEGPKWWVGSATAMGCICPRRADAKADSFSEVFMQLWEQVRSQEEGV